MPSQTAITYHSGAYTLPFFFPTHQCTQEWKNGFFQRTTLQKLGHRVQLGHAPGVSCPFRTRGHKDFVIIDISGIHTIEVDFCGCDAALATPREQLLEVGWWPSTPLEPQSAATMTVLRSFHIWNLQGQISPTDFYRGLEQMTNGDGLSRVPVCGSIDCCGCGMLTPRKDRLTQWMLMVREWRHIKMVKRAGRGHDPTGIDGTPEGSLSIPCRPCPHADINLPTQWHDAPPGSRWVFLNDSQHTFLTYSQLAVYSIFI
jgi:hypothetical protein